jgi:hypothetical protein
MIVGGSAFWRTPSLPKFWKCSPTKVPGSVTARDPFSIDYDLGGAIQKISELGSWRMHGGISTEMKGPASALGHAATLLPAVRGDVRATDR